MSIVQMPDTVSYDCRHAELIVIGLIRLSGLTAPEPWVPRMRPRSVSARVRCVVLIPRLLGPCLRKGRSTAGEWSLCLANIVEQHGRDVGNTKFPRRMRERSSQIAA